MRPSVEVGSGGGYDRRIWLVVAALLVVVVLLAIVLAARGDGSHSGPGDMGGMNMSAPAPPRSGQAAAMSMTMLW